MDPRLWERGGMMVIIIIPEFFYIDFLIIHRQDLGTKLIAWIFLGSLHKLRLHLGVGKYVGGQKNARFTTKNAN